ncbi:hypothetical protein P9B08_03535 [Bacillus safensis]|uniref:hypothetical protein n=1 Tax=Bacillus TaxID=1386 RepID=UPI000F77DDC3|nr:MULTISPECIES: hypothetical protein [Bacillus]MBQ4842528.1 hypothetical protein [Bacillus safensis]MBQ4872045.1 hypothetical protein [Bacillus safensis]MBQ4885671.1 hypothetical protein [Bacillus safensis]MBT2262149.1 hypothetical protein [Bacillus safensis]MBU8605655.1 hypothetical protein [Bacillus safensis]
MKFDKNLISCFNIFKRIQISYEPDIPGFDESIWHKILGHDLFVTRTGVLLLIHLENPENGEEYTYSFPDIIKVELANSSNSHEKWYLYSLDRSKFKEDIRNEEMIYRLIFSK